jgi:hypothetical protein
MSTQRVQAMAQPLGRTSKPVAKTADFKGLLARAQAPFDVQPRPAALARGVNLRAGEDAFRSRIAALESAGSGWSARNAASGALGRYQFLPVALRDIGW